MHQNQERKAAGWFDWAYKGVDHSFPGNGGLECRDFLSLSQRCWESGIASFVALLALLYAYPRLRLPRNCPCSYMGKRERMGKRILLLLMCLTFGIELGFKFATRQMIWIGNPCHLATMMQIFILAAPPSRIVTSAFRLHMHMLTGAPIAILFPVINTRLLPFETEVYFLQHCLMLIIPFYLMRIGDPFVPEKLLDFNWALVSFGFLFIYHFLPLQILAYVSQVNLNNMLCPAVSDPFHGKYYRLFAIGHQLILIPLQGKLFVVIAKAFRLLPSNNPEEEGPLTEVFEVESAYSCAENTCCSSNMSQDSCCSSAAASSNSPLVSEGDSGFIGGDPIICSSLGHQEYAQSTDTSSKSKKYCGISSTKGGHHQGAISEVIPSGEEPLGPAIERSTRNVATRQDSSASVVRRLVNGRIMVDSHEGSGEGGRKAEAESSGKSRSLTSRAAEPRTIQLQSGRSKPLTMSDLDLQNNGHCKMY